MKHKHTRNIHQHAPPDERKIIQKITPTKTKQKTTKTHTKRQQNTKRKKTDIKETTTRKQSEDHAIYADATNLLMLGGKPEQTITRLKRYAGITKQANSIYNGAK